MGVEVTRYSPTAKIPTLAATEQARRALRGETELASKPRRGIDQVKSSAVSAIEKGHPNGCRGDKVFALCAKIPTLAAIEQARRALRGETELASKPPLWGIDQVESSAVLTIEKGHPNGCPFSMVEVTRFELATSTSRT